MGSEMCIRDSLNAARKNATPLTRNQALEELVGMRIRGAVAHMDMMVLMLTGTRKHQSCNLSLGALIHTRGSCSTASLTVRYRLFFGTSAYLVSTCGSPQK